MIAPLTRIVLRYVAGFLVAKGLLDAEIGSDIATDPDILAIAEIWIGAAVGAGTEAVYFIARRLGWKL